RAISVVERVAGEARGLEQRAGIGSEPANELGEARESADPLLPGLGIGWNRPKRRVPRVVPHLVLHSPFRTSSAAPRPCRLTGINDRRDTSGRRAAPRRS